MTFRLTFLGTSGAVPTPERNPTGIHVNRDGTEVLFDVGEGIQRQMMRFSTGFGLDYVLITHLHGDHFYGLPGLLETLAFTDRTRPLTVVCPARLVDRLERFVRVSVGETPFPLQVAGIEPGAVAIRSAAFEVRAVRVEHDATAVGYALVEDDRPGRFDRERAIELGVPEGPKFGQLHRGDPVELDDGTVVEPAQVVGPPRPGRSVVYTGDTRPSEGVVEAAAGAQLLIHDATFGDDLEARAAETAHSTARQAGRVARDAGVDRLAMVHTSARYAGARERLVAEASEVFDGEILLPDDGDEVDVDFPR
ncbi:MAG: ribonuclease Z [Halobacteriales archaeon]